MRLTEAGEAFLPFAEHSVQAISDGRDRLSELRRGTLGKLVLGAPPTVSTYALPALLARFTAEHPGVRLTVMTGTSEEILELVLHDRVQIGLMRALGNTEVEAVPVYSDALLAIVSPGHRLAGRGVRLAELAGEPLVLFGRSSSYRVFTEAVFRQAGVMPDSVLELVNITLPRREIVAVRRRDAGPPSGTVATFMTLLTEVGSLIVGSEPPPRAASVKAGARAEAFLPALDT